MKNNLCIYCIYQTPMNTHESLDLTWHTFWLQKCFFFNEILIFKILKKKKLVAPLFFNEKKVFAPLFSWKKYLCPPNFGVLLVLNNISRRNQGAKTSAIAIFTHSSSLFLCVQARSCVTSHQGKETLNVELMVWVLTGVNLRSFTVTTIMQVW